MDTIPLPRSPSDVSDEEWALLVPYLTLMREDALQHHHAVRERFTGLRYIARTGLPWRFMPIDLPPWHAVSQQTRRWLDAAVFDAIVADLRDLIRLGQGRSAQPTAVILDRRTRQSTPESGARAGGDGAKRRTGTKVHLAVDTLGHLLAVQVTPANAQDRAPVGDLAAAVQKATGQTVTLADVDQGDTGDTPRQAAATHGIDLVVERDFGWMSRFRRLARDQERLADVLTGVHVIAFMMLMGKQVLPVLSVL